MFAVAIHMEIKGRKDTENQSTYVHTVYVLLIFYTHTYIHTYVQ